MHEESPNGGAKWWLADGERRCVLTLAEGKEMGKGENLWPLSPFIGEGESDEIKATPGANIRVPPWPPPFTIRGGHGVVAVWNMNLSQG
jgi:hypothetical protein